jgi:hypothetical protein
MSNDLDDLSKAIARGISGGVMGVLFVFGIAFLIIGVISSMFTSYDSTDDERNGVRSGLVLHIDHGTGCQYLSKPGAGLTPRLDDRGEQICDK